MDVRRLDLLRELSERGSVTEVARATHRTPSAVSQQLKVLEREAGMPLTEKSGRGLVLTAAGEALARSATDVAVAIEKANAVWDRFRNHPSGQVKLVTFPTAGQMLLPAVLTDVAKIPGLNLLVSDEDAPLEQFPEQTNEFDIVLAHTLPGHAPWGGRGLRVQHLMIEPLDIGIPASHPLAGKPWLTPHDIAGEPWIGAPSGLPFDRILTELADAAGTHIEIVQRVSDLRISEAFVAAGFGLALIPRYTSGDVDPEQIVLKPIRGIRAEREIVALMRPDVAERLAVSTVAELLRTHAARVQSVHAHPSAQRP